MFSDTNLLFVSVWPTVLLALSVVLVLIEYLLVKKHRRLFATVDSIFLAAVCGVFIWQQCALSDILILVTATLAVRLVFEIIEGRKAVK